MPKTPENEVIELLRKSLAEKELPKDLKITFRLSGGAPSKQVMEEVRMAGTGRHEVSRSDEIRSLPLEKGKVKLSQAETRELFEKIAGDLDKLVPRSKAAFPPDSVLGCFSVEVGDQKADFFYAVEEEEQPAERALVGSSVIGATETLRALVSEKLDQAGRTKKSRR